MLRKVGDKMKEPTMGGGLQFAGQSLKKCRRLLYIPFPFGIKAGNGIEIDLL